MKNKIVIITLLATMGLSVLTGCGKQTTEQKEKATISSELDAVNSEMDAQEDADEKIYKELDGFKPAKQWKDKDYKAKGYQIADVFIYEGEKLSDVIEAFKNSKLDWEYQYNPEGTVDNQTYISFNYKNKQILNINVIAETEDKKCQSKDSVVYYMQPDWHIQDYEYLCGVKRGDTKKYTFEDLGKLKDTMFKDIDDVEVNAGTSDYSYTVTYPVQTPNKKVEYHKTYKFIINDNGTCSFTIMTSTSDM